MTKPLKPEALLQKQCVDHLRAFCPNVRVVASMNGLYLGKGANKAVAIQKAKNSGMMVGEPDLRLEWPNRGILFIELKAKGKKPNKNQADRLADLACMGFLAEWCDNFDDFLEILDVHGVPQVKHRYT